VIYSYGVSIFSYQPVSLPLKIISTDYAHIQYYYDYDYGHDYDYSET